jgi:ABC-type polysaccharide/polyol phosphate export permease
MWVMLGNQDIKLKYRRSTIGPFWITISMAVTIFSMGFLYGHLFKLNLQDYFPYLASGVIGWSFISTLILEGNNVFIEAESYIRNQDSFMSIFMMRLLLKNSVIFLHNMLVFIPIIFIYHTPISFKILLIIPGLAIIGINAICWGTLIAIIGTRYRDFQQIINSLIQVVFFLTPIMWTPNLLPEKYQWIVLYNPFNQLLNLIREPMMNHVIGLNNLVVVLTTTLIGFLLYACFIKKYKYRIVFWL